MVQAAQAGTSVAAALTVKSVEQLAGSGTRFAYAVKAGPWIFLNGHEAFDFERGLAPEVEGPLGSRLSGRPPLRREADYILQRMRSTLKEFGCDLANAVRGNQTTTSGRRCMPITWRALPSSAATFRRARRSSCRVASLLAPTSTPP